MSENNRKIISPIPVRTWRGLGVNHAFLEEQDIKLKPYHRQIFEKRNSIDEFGIVTELTEKQNQEAHFIDKQYKGLDQNILEQCIKEYNTGVYIEAQEGTSRQEPIILHYTLDKENNTLIDNNLIIAKENSEITVIIQYDSKVKGYHNGLTRIFGKKGSRIKLVKVQTLSDDSTHLDAVYTKLEDNAEIEYTLIELGAKNGIIHNQSDLIGTNSRTNLKMAYITDKDRKIDMNYIMNHVGRETNSQIDVKGALLDEADKIFRGTIDLRKGAVKAKGKEEEYTILLSDKVRNRSVPILLCTEHEVEGQHAASTGKVDENKLFYLMSRGLSEYEAKKLIVEASLNPIIDQIPDELIREEINDYVRRKFINE
ncbi:Fe-S cluster assembly protein SufD [Anaeromicropila herbilytica]|uniref:Fe-S cluster assembly protein SufD n=1 Tax=Anaeromicropila herbilytica TaxID=2785025 RepID=A0A7R7ICA2_9FIRM|nr:Fe-S cluster assembly protein SufD [Anaeromicropila herbilytica]BCN30382.1 Fe-S cluster assembly protein SufD [Anaeromicropila herbilytica]